MSLELSVLLEKIRCSMMVRLLVLKKARSWTISLLQRSSGHVILGMQLGFRAPSGLEVFGFPLQIYFADLAMMYAFVL